MNNSIKILCTFVCALLLVSGTLFVIQEDGASADEALTPIEQLGKLLFFDTNLSEPAGQSCASCHDPAFGFVDPDQGLPVSEGVIAGLFGGRNTPSAGYATFTPEFDATKTEGGQFWDGRATNLTEQAKGPFLNPVEMNNPDQQAVIDKIAVSSYASLFEQVFGPNAFADTAIAYHNMATAIAAYEGTAEVSPFTSKFDAWEAGLVELTAQEELGEKLFTGKAKCGHCHPTRANGNDPVLFTDFDFHNIGVPQNTEFPFSLQNPIPIDIGLGGFTGDNKDNGKFKTPHLRNIELTGPYMHNGFIKTLKDVVNFYNTRDVAGEWPAPELSDNLDSKFMGNLGLTDAEEDAIVAFMLTFTDGFMLPAVLNR
jgi:cytochrome c peroxidase